MKPLTLLFFALCSLVLFTGCPDDDGTGGGGLSIPQEPNIPPCGVGFDYDEATQTCSCPPDKKVIGPYDCFDLPEGFYYATMDGCLIDHGMAIMVNHQDTASYVDRYNFFSIRTKIYIDRRPSTANRYFTSPIKFYSRPIANNRDSIFFEYVSESYGLPDSENISLPKLLFKGVSNRSDTIRGVMEIGAQSDFLLIGELYDSCEVLFLKDAQ